MDESLTADTSNFAGLTPTEQKELQQFLQNEGSKARIQATVHTLTDLCWKKCVTSRISSTKLDGYEESCMQNCVDRFVDSQTTIVKHLETLRQRM